MCKIYIAKITFRSKWNFYCKLQWMIYTNIDGYDTFFKYNECKACVIFKLNTLIKHTVLKKSNGVSINKEKNAYGKLIIIMMSNV